MHGSFFFQRKTDCRAYSIPKYSAQQFFQGKTDCRAYSIPKYNARQFFCFFLEKNRLLYIQHSKVQCTAVSFFREKQTAVHIAFQNTVHGSFFREKQTAVHIVLESIARGYRAQRHGVYVESIKVMANECVVTNCSTGYKTGQKKTSIHFLEDQELK